ncbi:unnamed protein product [Victoria cruziana]
MIGNRLKRCLDEKGEPEAKTAKKESSVSRSKLKDSDMRSYQLEAYEAALARNTIVWLETGSGKTMIAIMLMKEIARRLRGGGDKRIIIFLAPTVHLVQQQCSVIKNQTDLHIDEYYGAKNIDGWDLRCWQKETGEKEVMVMTPQILLDALRNAFVALDMVRLLIFDECHRAAGNHPYARIMLEYYHRIEIVHKPKVFGMTASPVIRKGVSSVDDCQYQISELEKILDSKVFTFEDRNELEVHVPMAKEIKRYYSSWFVNEDLRGELDSLWTKFDTIAEAMENPTQKQFIEKDLRAKLCSFHLKILYCLENLGILCSYKAVKVCMQRDGVAANIEENACPNVLLSNYLEEALHIFKEYLSAEACHLLETEANLDPVYMNFISPKLCELMNTINTLKNPNQVLCMVFVERVITARVICWLVKKLKSLSHLSCDYLTGNTSAINGLTAKRQRMVMDYFREGKVNLLLTTDVAEEGIDVHNCSCVIRFDLPKTVRSYIQSRGRARYADSLYVLMLERGNEEHKDLLFEIFRSERTMLDATSSRETTVSKLCFKVDAPVYTVSSTGATVTPDSSVSLIFTYCHKLPGDKYFQPRPDFHYDLCGGIFECTLTLPPNAAFQRLKGPPAKSSHLAKKLVCLDACKKLHEMKALNDHLLPVDQEFPDYTFTREVNSAPGAGTTRRKELHGSAIADALSGTWANVLDSITLQAYSLTFSCNVIEEKYQEFIFLIKEELDEDVAHAEIDLFLQNNKVVKARVSPCGQVYLNMDQLMRSKTFHELFFNGLFGKLYHISKSSGAREIVLAVDNTTLWPSTNMYLLLPMLSVQSKESPTIDWKIIDSCCSVAECLKANHLPMAMNNFHMEVTQRQDEKKGEKVHLFNTSYGFPDLKDKVVVAIHTGRMYYVTDLVNDATADSPFDGSYDSAKPSYSSYTDYFKKKYGINLRYNAQPLLRLKQNHNPHNLLSGKQHQEGGSVNNSGESDLVRMTKEHQGYVYMPPELLIRLDVPRDIWRSLYLLPSVSHRMESKILASQLRKAICSCPSSHLIPVDLILEALTTRRCAEAFSMERLELLGDSVLKYAVSCNLFLKYPEKHEGKLTALRSLAVCNATLHRLATVRKLQNYIQDSPFDAPRWLAPGQRSLRPVPCECGVNSREVPLTHPTAVEHSAIKIGVTCDLGHRWLCSKTISDCLEALIGAYYVSGGMEAAQLFMTWVGVDCEHDLALVEEATRKASEFSFTIEDKNIDALESKLGYKFLNKGLLLEAITHASQQEAGSGCCYQRLEFLGDSVLDLLITWHLFESHKDIDQGELTDLRSASVNNEKFAQASVMHNLQQHLLHGSDLLLTQISDYVKFLKSFPENVPLPVYSKSKGPKVLGDLIESIAGAILIDSKLNLGEVWRVFKPILSPFPTPEDLQLHPLRELFEICGEAGVPLCTDYRKEGEQTIAKVTIQLKDGQLTAEGCDKIKATALEQAALLLLNAMERKGVSHKRSIWRGKSERVEDILPCSQGQTSGLSPVEGHHAKVSIDVKKGGPRTSLFQLCKDMNWVRPTFEPRASGARFISKVTLHVPDSDNMEAEGEEKMDKKSSMDSAALVLLYKLGELGKCIIEEC